MKKVVFVLPDMRIGGLQQVAHRLYPFFSKEYDLFFALIEKEVELVLPEGIKLIVNKNKSSDIWKTFKVANIIHKVKTAIDIRSRFKESVFISWDCHAGFYDMLGAIKNSCGNHRNIFSIHNFPNKKLLPRDEYLKYSFVFHRKKKIDNFVSCSYGISKYIERRFKIGPQKSRVIHNPINIEKVRSLGDKIVPMLNLIDNNDIILLNVGRLHYQKNQIALIRIFSRLKKIDKYKEAKLFLIGDGPLKNKLITYARRRNLKVFDIWSKKFRDDQKNSDVYFLGNIENPFPFMSKASLFLLPSHWEGFPNVLVEALSLGLPCIAADCKTGPREILDGDRSGEYVFQPSIRGIYEAQYGMLIPDVSLLTDKKMRNKVEEMWMIAIDYVLENRDKFVEKSLNFSNQIGSLLSCDKLFQKWKEVID